MPKTIELNDEEMDWFDNGNSFCALDDLPREDYDEISYRITLKIRESYKQAELKNNKLYELSLSEKEIDYIFDLMIELLIDIEYREKIVEVKSKHPELREECEKEFKELLTLTNILFNKMGKPIQTLKTLEEYVKQQNYFED